MLSARLKSLMPLIGRLKVLRLFPLNWISSVLFILWEWYQSDQKPFDLQIKLDWIRLHFILCTVMWYMWVSQISSLKSYSGCMCECLWTALPCVFECRLLTWSDRADYHGFLTASHKAEAEHRVPPHLHPPWGWGQQLPSIQGHLLQRVTLGHMTGGKREREK